MKPIDEFSKPVFKGAKRIIPDEILIEDPEEELSVLDPELWKEIKDMCLCEFLYLKCYQLGHVPPHREKEFEEWLCSNQHFLNWNQVTYCWNDKYIDFVMRSPLIIKRIGTPGHAIVAGESLTPT